jgi:hypothetical protein
MFPGRTRLLRSGATVLLALGWAFGPSTGASTSVSPTPTGLTGAFPSFGAYGDHLTQRTGTVLASANLVAHLPPTAIPESRRLTLEFPEWIRVGDSGVVRLTLEVDRAGKVTPTAEVNGNLVPGESLQLLDPYRTHNVVAEATLDLAGMDLRPSGPVGEPLLPGESVTFLWSIHPSAVGIYRGTAWLSLIFIDKSSSQQSRTTVSAQPLQIEATNFLGLGGDAARGMGGVGAVVGGILGVPFAGDALKNLRKKIRRRA